MSNLIDPKKVFVLVPSFNEQQTIREVCTDLLKEGYQVVVVDDGSSESLYPVLKGLPLHLLRHTINLGQGAALQTGIEFAIAREAEYFVTFDADGQHQVSNIIDMLNHLIERDLDLVYGTRFMPGARHNMSKGRRILLQIARFLNFVFTGLLLTDAHNGLRVMNRQTATRIHLHENGMAHATEFLMQTRRLNLKYAEFPVTIKYTEYSLGKGQSLWNGFRIFFDILLNKLFK